MNEADRKQIHKLVWNEMKRLEDVGLGYRDDARKSRDNFVLNDGPRAKLVQKDIEGGVIRSDIKNGLLFRAASDNFISKVSGVTLSYHKHKSGGIEFSWSVLNHDETLVSKLFIIVLTVASTT